LKKADFCFVIGMEHPKLRKKLKKIQKQQFAVSLSPEIKLPEFVWLPENLRREEWFLQERIKTLFEDLKI
jgi:hypothetical protein